MYTLLWLNKEKKSLDQANTEKQIFKKIPFILLKQEKFATTKAMTLRKIVIVII